MKRIQSSYKNAGVDISVGDKASKIMFEVSKLTWQNREGLIGQIECPIDNFSGIRFANASDFPNALLGMNFDGVGTKIEIAERVDSHTTIAYDLFAMVCDDASIKGAEPLHVGSIIDFKKISLKVIKELAKGMVVAARNARVAVINGEIAELGDRVGGFGNHCYNWGATVFWIAKKNRIITGENIKPGDTIIGVWEAGLRSNGISLVRDVLKNKYGDKWHCEKFEGSTLGEKALEPSKIYTPLIIELTGGYDREPKAETHGFAHITGGGIPGKLGRLLKVFKYGAVLSNLFEPSALMKHCQSIAKISDFEAYKTWNMGQGLLIITPTPAAVNICARNQGFVVREVGKIIDSPLIIIHSKGFFSNDEKIIQFTAN